MRTIGNCRQAYYANRWNTFDIGDLQFLISTRIMRPGSSENHSLKGGPAGYKSGDIGIYQMKLTDGIFSKKVI